MGLAIMGYFSRRKLSIIVQINEKYTYPVCSLVEYPIFRPQPDFGVDISSKTGVKVIKYGASRSMHPHAYVPRSLELKLVLQL